jgi:mannose-6-phosphate isomerase-like protein (cupin superfamily)
MAAYTLANLKTDVDDMAPQFGLSPDLEAHFARQALDMEQSGLSYQRAAPGFRVPFGHTHAKQEETYVILSGSGRAKVGDEIIEVKALDALRVAPGSWRGMEAGPDGIELVAFGARPGMAPDENDSEMEQGWWND